MHSVFALRDGKPLRCVWYDRSSYCLASRGKGDPPKLEAFASQEILELDTLPCWKRQGMAAEEMQDLVAGMVDEIAEEAAAEHRARGTRPRDPQVFMRVHPHQRPKKTKRSPAPFVHAASREVRERFKEAYRIFSEVFRSAAEVLKDGKKDARFPEGSFPPGLPFVAVPLLEPG